MKKRGFFVCCMLLVAVLALALCGCSAYGGIKTAYEQAGYTEIELTDEIKRALNITDEENEDVATVHFFTNAKIGDDDSDAEIVIKIMASKFALIWEYKDVETLQNIYKEDLNEEQQQKFDELWQEYQKSPRVNQNCILILGDEEIFKSTK